MAVLHHAVISVVSRFVGYCSFWMRSANSPERTSWDEHPDESVSIPRTGPAAFAVRSGAARSRQNTGTSPPGLARRFSAPSLAPLCKSPGSIRRGAFALHPGELQAAANGRPVIFLIHGSYYTAPMAITEGPRIRNNLAAMGRSRRMQSSLPSTGRASSPTRTSSGMQTKRRASLSWRVIIWPGSSRDFPPAAA